jgi:GT2 family glycosyltransferase
LDEEGQPELIESDWLTGCCLLIKRQAFEKAGLLNERFFLYWEDTDWGLRLHRAGLRTVVVPSAHIWHKISVSTGGTESALKAYHKIRSHLLFAQLHAPHATFALQWRVLRDIAWLAVKSRQPDRAKKARAYAAAIMDYHAGRTDRGPQWLWSQG